MKVRIEVTRDDIERGWCQSHNRCPIARAVKRSVKDLGGVSVSNIDLMVFLLGEDERISMWSGEMPDEAQRFVAEFDEGGQVEPIVFEMELR